MIAYILAACTMLLFPFTIAAGVRAAGGSNMRRVPEQPADAERLARLEGAGATLTNGVERLGEAQRFLPRLLEQRSR